MMPQGNSEMDPIHFAAVIGINLEMGNISPPTTPRLYLGVSVTGVPIEKMLWPTIYLILFACFPTLILTTFIPSISFWLPEFLLG